MVIHTQAEKCRGLGKRAFYTVSLSVNQRWLDIEHVNMTMFASGLLATHKWGVHPSSATQLRICMQIRNDCKCPVSILQMLRPYRIRTRWLLRKCQGLKVS